MTAEKILNRDDWQKCIEFHGHTCPGVAIGYRAARAGLEVLDKQRSRDEELVAIVETNACGADAIQVLTGCTFGKGNFVFKDYGKHAFVFFSRKSGKGFRVVLRPEILELERQDQQLIDKVREETANEQEQSEFKKLHLKRTRAILDQPIGLLFNIREVQVPIPEKAKMAPSKICESCGEPAMSSMFEEVDGKWLCRGCREA